MLHHINHFTYSLFKTKNTKKQNINKIHLYFRHRNTIKMSSKTNSNHDQNYNRLQEVVQFDESKVGVKGLVDSGLKKIPKIFHHPPENLPKPNSNTQKPKLSIPTIDLSGQRSTVVNKIHHSASTLGFFQIINHGIPKKVMDDVVTSIKCLNELPEETRKKYYTRDMSNGATYSTNFDLYHSKAACWRDSLQVTLGPTPPKWEYVPDVCRDAVNKWDQAVVKLGEVLMGLLCEGLGVKRDRLKEMSFLNDRNLSGHYYPYCPEPDLTVGLAWHTDPGMVTVVLQNEVVGLQVKCGEDWIDVEPVPGGLIVNIGDMLQIMSNDEYKSVEHRVLANSFHDPRVSVALFFNPNWNINLYGPLPELISSNKPAVYRQFTMSDFMNKFFTKELHGKDVTNYYKVKRQEG